MMRHPHTPRQRHAGFTITELLVVIGIIILMMGLLAPALKLLGESSKSEAGINTINSAVAAARAYSTKSAADLDPPVPGAKFSGTALLFCPTQEIRLVKNAQLAKDGNSDYLESKNPSLNGYADISTDYIRVPGGVGVVGLTRGNAGVRLLAPPFAIRFDPSGNLVAAISSDTDSAPKLVYYDSNYDGTYLLSAERTSGYDPDRYNPASPKFDPSQLHDNRVKFPIEKIETVIAVVVFPRAEFLAAGHNFVAGGNGGVSSSAQSWILDHGKALFFSRYTGSIMRD